MGCTPVAACGAAGTATTTPRTNPYLAIEAAQASTGKWWLCVHADLERIHSGPFDTKKDAETRLAWLVGHWNRRNGVNP